MKDDPNQLGTEITLIARIALHLSYSDLTTPEFLYYLFRDLVADFGKNALISKSHAFKDIFFAPPNYQGMMERAHARIERKDHDFVIGVTISANLDLKTNRDHEKDGQLRIAEEPGEYTARWQENSEIHYFDIAAVAIECKTYLDKTMLEGSSRAAEQLKARNPNSLYIVVMEWLQLTSAVNLHKYEVDQIYVFRKQKKSNPPLPIAFCLLPFFTRKFILHDYL